MDHPVAQILGEVLDHTCSSLNLRHPICQLLFCPPCRLWNAKAQFRYLLTNNNLAEPKSLKLSPALGCLKKRIGDLDSFKFIFLFTFSNYLPISMHFEQYLVSILLSLVYCTRAIIRCGLYIINPFFERQKLSFGELFLKILDLSTVSIQEWVMIAHVEQINNLAANVVYLLQTLFLITSLCQPKVI